MARSTGESKSFAILLECDWLPLRMFRTSFKHILRSIPQKGWQALLAVILHRCNDCRHATGTVVSAWFCVPTDYIFGACVSRPALPSTIKQAEESLEKYLAEEDKGTVWISGNDIFKPGAEANKDTLRQEGLGWKGFGAGSSPLLGLQGSIVEGSSIWIEQRLA
jgi:hypothetical protein